MPKTLTPAQIRILALMGQGCSQKEIAGACGVSTRAVRSQLNAVRERLGGNITTGQLIRYAIRSNFCRLQPTIDEIAKGLVSYEPRHASLNHGQAGVPVTDDEPSPLKQHAVDDAA